MLGALRYVQGHPALSGNILDRLVQLVDGLLLKCHSLGLLFESNTEISVKVLFSQAVYRASMTIQSLFSLALLRRNHKNVKTIIQFSVSLLQSLSPNLILCRRVCEEISGNSILLFWICCDSLIKLVNQHKLTTDIRSDIMPGVRTGPNSLLLSQGPNSSSIPLIEQNKKVMLVNSKSVTTQNWPARIRQALQPTILTPQEFFGKFSRLKHHSNLMKNSTISSESTEMDTSRLRSLEFGIDSVRFRSGSFHEYTQQSKSYILSSNMPDNESVTNRLKHTLIGFQYLLHIAMIESKELGLPFLNSNDWISSFAESFLLLLPSSSVQMSERVDDDGYDKWLPFLIELWLHLTVGTEIIPQHDWLFWELTKRLSNYVDIKQKLRNSRSNHNTSRTHLDTRRNGDYDDRTPPGSFKPHGSRRPSNVSIGKVPSQSNLKRRPSLKRLSSTNNISGQPRKGSLQSSKLSAGTIKRSPSASSLVRKPSFNKLNSASNIRRTPTKPMAILTKKPSFNRSASKRSRTLSANGSSNSSSSSPSKYKALKNYPVTSHVEEEDENEPPVVPLKDMSPRFHASFYTDTVSSSSSLNPGSSSKDSAKDYTRESMIKMADLISPMTEISHSYRNSDGVVSPFTPSLSNFKGSNKMNKSPESGNSGDLHYSQSETKLTVVESMGALHQSFLKSAEKSPSEEEITSFPPWRSASDDSHVSSSLKSPKYEKGNSNMISSLPKLKLAPIMDSHATESPSYKVIGSSENSIASQKHNIEISSDTIVSSLDSNLVHKIEKSYESDVSSQQKIDQTTESNASYGLYNSLQSGISSDTTLTLLHSRKDSSRSSSSRVAFSEVRSESKKLDKFKVGDEIEAIFSTEDSKVPHWFVGKVELVNPDGTYRIRYNIGDIQDNKPSSEIRRHVVFNNPSIISPKSDSEVHQLSFRSKKGDLSSRFKVGDTVDGLYQLPNGRKRWYPATIQVVNADGSYKVMYRDGDVEENKPVHDIKMPFNAPEPSNLPPITGNPLAASRKRADSEMPRKRSYTNRVSNILQVGEEVYGLFTLPNGKKRWFPGRIADSYPDETFKLLYKDGDIQDRKPLFEIRKAKVIPADSSVENSKPFVTYGPRLKGTKITSSRVRKLNKPSSTDYALGVAVDGLFTLPNGKKRWFPGKITGVHLDGTYRIHYLDGDSEDFKQSKEIRLSKIIKEYPQVQTDSSKSILAHPISPVRIASHPDDIRNSNVSYIGRASEVTNDVGRFSEFLSDTGYNSEVMSVYGRDSEVCLDSIPLEPQFQGSSSKKSEISNPTTLPTTISYDVNEMVEALYVLPNGSKRWYSGTVTAINSDGTYHITYSDGDQEPDKPITMIRKPKLVETNILKTSSNTQVSILALKTPVFSLGDLVDGLYRLPSGSERWYSGKIVAVYEHNCTYKVQYDDSDVQDNKAENEIRHSKKSISVPTLSTQDMGFQRQASVPSGREVPPVSEVEPSGGPVKTLPKAQNTTGLSLDFRNSEFTILTEDMNYLDPKRDDFLTPKSISECSDESDDHV